MDVLHVLPRKEMYVEAKNIPDFLLQISFIYTKVERRKGARRMRVKGIYYASEKDAELLRTEFFLNYITVASRKVEREHCIIRLILSSLATPSEIRNLTKRDLREGKFYSVKLFTGGKTRISPIDEKTFKMVKKMAENVPARNSIFNLSEEEIDEIVKRNSPPAREYDAERLRNDAIKIITDNLFFDTFDLTSKPVEKMYLIFQDSNPLYSGAWDIDDDFMLADFLQSYSMFLGKEDLEKIAEKIGEPVERLKRVSKEF